ncbi:pyridoxal-dependent decarboxylase [Candidimonas sp. SYP-B2681]|uniref:pyridoxal phosphate-dependent decarboxylase family protein n=1 Tax=Candidimonas sp. SYP-B2681 TaxID=2497686 RepID=UPI0018F78298|nr:pyridoxal-dependent decarboxylase [Candidimonas sp. SYP-B2681]
MDKDFTADPQGLRLAVDLLQGNHSSVEPIDLPEALPETGSDVYALLNGLAPHVLGKATRLGDATAFAHMDPPTPWITWATTLWNASLNQNLLHPATAPVARDIEERIVKWLVPFFGMNGGHMTPGSTLANLTALWAARECAGVQDVVASDNAHLSIAKAAHILGLNFKTIPTDRYGALVTDVLPENLRRTALVLTAGTTGTGLIDPLHLAGKAAWTHIDAAWAGPLRLSSHASRLAGIENADSVAVSAHKWLFQPKESALVMFRDVDKAQAGITFGGNYLAVPNVGVLGSHGATAVPLLATLLAWGRQGLATRIEHCMTLAEQLGEFLQNDMRTEILLPPQTGVVVWRPKDTQQFDLTLRRLPPGLVSTTRIAEERWFRCVAANPNADIHLLTHSILQALDQK